MIDYDKYNQIVENTDTLTYIGKVKLIVGLRIESSGPLARIGDICRIYRKKGNGHIEAEVIGFAKNRVLLMPYGSIKDIGIGSRVEAINGHRKVPVGDNLVGRVLDGLGNPMDFKGPVKVDEYMDIDSDPPNPISRKRITAPIHLGIKSMDSLLTCGEGQRIGIFAGTGVGKSVLLGMIARNSSADINVIALVGERGREVKEFLEKELQEGIKKSVVVVATSDQPALLRVKAAMTATAIAEYFRSKGKRVLLMMDSLTRVAIAQREVGLATGEPPVARGYTPSVFAMLPRLLERSGCSEISSITAIYTVLVEGDEMNEPISDAVRGILDGHVVLSRKLAQSNHFPAIDILHSISRVMPDIVDEAHMEKASAVRNIMSDYEEARDLINIGAYKKGSNKKIDLAISRIDGINKFLKQGMREEINHEESMKAFMNLV